MAHFISNERNRVSSQTHMYGGKGSEASSWKRSGMGGTEKEGIGLSMDPRVLWGDQPVEGRGDRQSSHGKKCTGKAALALTCSSLIQWRDRV
jgi:hypothetical protein